MDRMNKSTSGMVWRTTGTCLVGLMFAFLEFLLIYGARITGSYGQTELVQPSQKDFNKARLRG